MNFNSKSFTKSKPSPEQNSSQTLNSYFIRDRKYARSGARNCFISASQKREIKSPPPHYGDVYMSSPTICLDGFVLHSTCFLTASTSESNDLLFPREAANISRLCPSSRSFDLSASATCAFHWRSFPSNFMSSSPTSLFASMAFRSCPDSCSSVSCSS